MVVGAVREPLLQKYIRNLEGLTLSDNTEATIRPASADDVAAIAVILRDIDWFIHIKEEPPADTEARIAHHLQLCDADDSHTVLVAEDSGGTVIGYVAVHWQPYLMLAGPEGYISELFVLTSEQGKGIGSRLLDVVKEQAIERGCVRLHLATGNYRPSYQIYKKLGWTERPKIANFILPLD